MKRLVYILYLVVILAYSCEDNIDFGEAKHSFITFSHDTLRFDTVFSNICSSTQRFKVYNSNNNGVKLDGIRLASNGTSGFQVNIDGQSGTSFDELAIYGDDSVYVFVKLIAKEQNADTPIEVKDSLVFQFSDGQEKSVILQAYVQDVVVLDNVIISENTVLHSLKPFVVYDSLVVLESATLEIKSGSRFYFHNDASLNVYGTVICDGEIDNPIVMRGLRTDKILPYLPYDRLDGQWGGIYFAPESFGNEFNNVDIHGGRYGIKCDMSNSDYYKLLMTNSSIHNVSSDGLFMHNCAGLFVNCEFSNSKGNCVALVGGNNQFLHCTIAQFYPWDVIHGSALYFCNVMNDTIFPLDKADFINCYITGSGDDEIFGSRLENYDVPFNCNFINCAVNTDLKNESSSKYFVNCISESDDSISFKSENFMCIDNDNFIYDFRLVKSSIARGVGDGQFVEYAPLDKDGRIRPIYSPDAGCYQYNEDGDD
jgi:hypothetical protein